MTDRPERAGRPAAIVKPGEHPLAGDQPAVIVVPYRAGRQSAKLLPPLLLVLLGTGFLAYRARSSDWRGISAFFETPPPVSLASAAPSPAESDTPPASSSPDVDDKSETKTKPETKPAEGEAGTVVEDKNQEIARDKDKAETKPEAGTETEAKTKPVGEMVADPRDDIRREAEQEEARIAALKAQKEKEAQRLEETAEERALADRRERRINPMFGLGRVGPEQIEELLKAQHEMLRRQMNGLARLHQQQMEEMAAMQREFFNRRGGMGMPLLPGRPLPPRPRPLPDLPADPNPGEFRQLPGGGVARFREFRGPNGMQGFRFEFRQNGPSLLDQDEAPPPPPRPRPLN